MAKLIQTSGRWLISAMLVFICSGVSFSFTSQQELNKGLVTDAQIQDMFMRYFCEVAKAFGPTPQSDPVRTAGTYAGYFLSLDGSDSLIAELGMSRESLNVLTRDNASANFGIPGLQTPLQMEQAAVTAKNLLNGPFTPMGSKASYRLPNTRKLLLGLNTGVDMALFHAPQTMLYMVPQDLADPRMFCGKPIKEWAADWSFSSTEFNAAVQSSFSPEFIGSHHGVIYYVYNELNSIYNKVYQRLMRGTPLYEYDVHPLSHLRTWYWSVLRQTCNDGWLHEQQGESEMPQKPFTSASILLGVFREPEARPFLARSLETMLRHGKVLFAVTNNDRNCQEILMRNLFQGYLVFRMLGGPDTLLTYTDVSARKLHGSYWYRTYRYVLHRTPDKMVSLIWNGLAVPSGTAADGAHPYEEWSDSLRSKAGTYGKFEMRVTQVVPDNDSLRPQDDPPHLFRSNGGMQGQLERYCKAGLQYSVNQSDGVMNTTGRIRLLDPTTSTGIKERVIQYQAFTSFYDKTCISLVKIVRGQYGAAISSTASWKDGFANSFYADKRDTNMYNRRVCYFEGDSVDMNQLGLFPIKDTSRVLGTSAWWCVNGRLGAAISGGTGSFIARSIAGPSEIGRLGYPYDRRLSATDKLPGVTIGYSVPLAPVAISNVAVNTGAAYYTDTPPDQVRALQRTLLSLDAQLPEGWKGLVSGTPDSQRVLALAHFYGMVNSAPLKLTFPEGAPVLEGLTVIKSDTARCVFTLDSVENLGQTLGFYVVGESDTVYAEQIGDIAIRLKGNGNATLKYLSRAQNNTVSVNGVDVVKSKAELRQGIALSLTSDWTIVRINNFVDHDHTGPGVHVVTPQYLSDRQTESPYNTNDYPALDEPADVMVPDGGLLVKVAANDRSGVGWVDVYLDWVKVGRIENAPYEIIISKDKFIGDSIHAIHAIACDALGNEEESFSVPFKVDGTGGTGAEQVVRLTAQPSSPVGRTARAHASAKSPLFEDVSRTSVPLKYISGMDARVARGRVQPKADVPADFSGICFKHDNAEYIFGLDAVKGKAVMFRKNKNGTVPIGDAVIQVKAGVWYELKVNAADGKMTGYVNNVERLTVEE